MIDRYILLQVTLLTTEVKHEKDVPILHNFFPRKLYNSLTAEVDEISMIDRPIVLTADEIARFIRSTC
jgi:DUF1365 family protein